MKTTTPIYCMCTFLFFNTKPVACNNDDKRIYIEAYVKRGNGKRNWDLIQSAVVDQ